MGKNVRKNLYKQKKYARENEIYFPNNELLKYFEPKSDTKFVDLDDYYSFITDEKDKVILKEFLLKLGVSEQPRILTRVISDWSEKNNIKTARFYFRQQGHEKNTPDTKTY